MLRIVIASLLIPIFLGGLTGCYGVAVGKKCQVCNDLKEGKAEGAEWTGEYINEKFQCKLEGGKVKVQIEDYWKDC
jgi:hypothetical protein